MILILLRSQSRTARRSEPDSGPHQLERSSSEVFSQCSTPFVCSPHHHNVGWTHPDEYWDLDLAWCSDAGRVPDYNLSREVADFNSVELRNCLLIIVEIGRRAVSYTTPLQYEMPTPDCGTPSATLAVALVPSQRCHHIFSMA